MELQIYNSVDETIKGLADFFVKKINEAITKKGKCDLVLAGGNSPKKLYSLLVSPAYKNKIDWQKVCFFFGDERYVPFTDKDNNGSMAKQTLLDPLNIDPSNIFYIDTSLEPNEAAQEYENKILTHFNKEPAYFDLVLLGLGDNAHTASLFPHTTVLHEKKKLVSTTYIDELQDYRITMTAPLINQAFNIAFLVYGENKSNAVYNVLKNPKEPDLFPAQLITGSKGKPHWFLDITAASLLSKRI